MIPGSHLHYRCAFDLHPNFKHRDCWSEVIKTIRAWVTMRAGNSPQIGGRWFYVGGDWRHPDFRRIRIVSEAMVGEGTHESPQFWSLRFEHPCDDVEARTWRTDIGITQLQAHSIRCVVTISHWLRTEYIGDERQPHPSAPGLIRALLTSEIWQAYSGDELLRPNAVRITAERAEDFVFRIQHLRRHCPIILITNEFSTGLPLIDPDKLARVLCGSASVYWAQDNEFDKSIERLLRWHFRCYGGMVRVYQPSVHLSDEKDSIRHRFFRAQDIKDQSSEVVVRHLVNGICRRGPNWVGEVVSSIEDVIDRNRAMRMIELRRRLDDTGALKAPDDRDEWVGLLEQDNVSLSKRIRELELRNQQLESDLESSEDNRDYYLDQLREECNRLRNENRTLKDQVTAIGEFRRLPQSMSEILVLIEQVHAGKIEFTDCARESAEEASFADLNSAWECLFCMGEDLWSLYYGAENVGNIEAGFRDRTGYELTLKEGPQTRNNKKLMSLRRQVWRNEEIDIEAHVKIGNKPPNLLRVYYWPDHGRKLLVVGHCGDHLDNASTRKRK